MPQNAQKYTNKFSSESAGFCSRCDKNQIDVHFLVHSVEVARNVIESTASQPCINCIKLFPKESKVSVTVPFADESQIMNNSLINFTEVKR